MGVKSGRQHKLGRKQQNNKPQPSRRIKLISGGAPGTSVIHLRSPLKRPSPPHRLHSASFLLQYPRGRPTERPELYFPGFQIFRFRRRPPRRRVAS